MMRKSQKVKLAGKEVFWVVAADLMDDELRETLNYKLAPCDKQEFIDAYAAAHEAKYGEEFEVS